MKRARAKIYILPGWGHKLTDKGYKRLISIFSRKYELVPLKIATRNRKWCLGNSKNFSEIVGGIESQIKKPCKRDAILGFSVGALEAYQMATHLKFEHVIICSISPCLGADLLSYPKKEALKTFSRNQFTEMAKMDYGKLKTKRATILYGEKELKILRDRSVAIGKLNKALVVEIRGGDHILNRRYLKAIEKII